MGYSIFRSGYRLEASRRRLCRLPSQKGIGHGLRALTRTSAVFTRTQTSSPHLTTTSTRMPLIINHTRFNHIHQSIINIKHTQVASRTLRPNVYQEHLRVNSSEPIRTMFGTGIYINEKDLDTKTPTKQTNSEDDTDTMTTSSTTTGTGTKDTKAPPTTADNKATSTTTNNKAIASTDYIPKPDPIPNPPASDHVDAGQGPKPEPVTRPPLTPLSFKLLWLAMMAPANPSI